MSTTTLIRAEFASNSGHIRRSYHTHLSDSNGKPLCGCNRRQFGTSDGINAKWLVIQGESPTCPQCNNAAKRRMQEGAA